MIDETLLFDPDQNKFCVLNGSAAVLWEKLDQPRTASDLSNVLCERFSGVDPGTAESDVRAALQQLEGMGLIATVD